MFQGQKQLISLGRDCFLKNTPKQKITNSGEGEEDKKRKMKFGLEFKEKITQPEIFQPKLETYARRMVNLRTTQKEATKKQIKGETLSTTHAHKSAG